MFKLIVCYCLWVVMFPFQVFGQEIEGDLTPVLIIPGMMGSELYKGDELIWPDVVRLVANISDVFLSENLRLDENGNSIKAIDAKNVIRQMFGTDAFEGLVSELESKGYVLGQTLFFFPYDWRLDLRHTGHLLATAVDLIREISGLDKIDIIAHSMGGLLSKQYMSEYGTELIRKIIYLGTPHAGAPKAFNTLLTGDIGVPLGIVNAGRIKEIAINSPAVYQLLFTSAYFPWELKPIHTVVDGVGQTLGFDQIPDFLSRLGKNLSLFERAYTFHHNLFLDWINNIYKDVEVYSIVGCKIPTQFSYYVSEPSGKIMYVEYGSGDGTVPNIAHLVFSPNVYFVPYATHASLPSIPNIRNLISQLLLEGKASDDNLDPGITKSVSACDINGQLLNWRSPVKVDVYDSENNHLGFNEQEIIELNIPGATYEIVDGEIYIFLPDNVDGEYKIQAVGTAAGEFDLIISDINNGEIGDSIFYDNVQIALDTAIKLEVNFETVGELMLDFNSSGEFETVAISEELTNLESIVNIVEAPILIEESIDAENTPVVEEQEISIPVISSGGGGGSTSAYSPVSEGLVLGINTSLLPDGTLVLDEIDGKTVYMIGSNGTKYGFASMEDFLGHGFNWQYLISADVSGYIDGGLVNSQGQRHPNGTLLYDGQTMWLLNHDSLFGFTNMTDLYFAGFTVHQAVNMNEVDKLLQTQVW